MNSFLKGRPRNRYDFVALPGGQINDALLMDSKMALYAPFEESSGICTADIAPHGTLKFPYTGFCNRTNILNNAGGKYGKMAVLDGAFEDKIIFGNSDDFKATTFSMWAWIKTNSTAAYKNIFGNATDDGAKFYGLSIRTGTGGAVMSTLLGDGSGSPGVYEGAGTFNDNVWHLIMVMYNAASLEVYIDKVRVINRASPSTIAYFEWNRMLVGARLTGYVYFTEYYTGSIDGFGYLSGRKLTTTEIADIVDGKLLRF